MSDTAVRRSDAAIEDEILCGRGTWTLDLSSATDDQLAAMALPPWHPGLHFHLGGSFAPDDCAKCRDAKTAELR